MLGGNYAVVMLIWITVGYIDRISHQYNLANAAPATPSLRGRRSDRLARAGTLPNRQNADAPIPTANFDPASR